MTTPAKKKKLVPSVFSHDQLQSIFASIAVKSATGLRNRALLAVMFGAALRVAEATNLMPSDIDFEKNEVLVRHGKGDKSRRVGILQPLLPLIQCWLEKRTALGFNGREPVFCTITDRAVGRTQKAEDCKDGTPKAAATYGICKAGTAISPAYVRGLLARLEKKVPELRLHSHAFRHSLANLLVEKGETLTVISAQLGHSSTAVTDKYLKKVSPAELCARIAAISIKPFNL